MDVATGGAVTMTKSDTAAIDAAAKAACKAAYGGVDYDQEPEDTKESWRRVARAAIDAYRRVDGEEAKGRGK